MLILAPPGPSVKYLVESKEGTRWAANGPPGECCLDVTYGLHGVSSPLGSVQTTVLPGSFELAVFEGVPLSSTPQRTATITIHQKPIVPLPI